MPFWGNISPLRISGVMGMVKLQAGLEILLRYDGHRGKEFDLLRRSHLIGS